MEFNGYKAVSRTAGRASINIYNADCMDLLKQVPDNYYSLSITDPPYGIGDFRQGGSRRAHDSISWNDGIPSAEYFAELERVSVNRIIWGANYYGQHIKDVGRIVHDKTGGQRRKQLKELSDADIASHSFGVNIKLFAFLWQGTSTGRKIPFHTLKRIHPCEKPHELYKWLLSNYAKPGDTILDTHLGSGSIAIACWDAGYDLDAWELDPDYYAGAVARLDKHKRQGQFELT